MTDQAFDKCKNILEEIIGKSNQMMKFGECGYGDISDSDVDDVDILFQLGSPGAWPVGMSFGCVSSTCLRLKRTPD